MRFQIFRYWCTGCRKWFEAPEITEYTYGEFLLRSNSGEKRYLNALLDKVFLEVDALIKLDSRVSRFDQIQYAELLHYVFGVACDPDSKGSVFRIGQNPICPWCGIASVEWESTEPPQFVDKDIVEVSHNEWEALSDEAKKERIYSALNSSSFF